MPAETRKIQISFFEWIMVGKFKVNASFYLYQISAIMILVITGVGSLIHLFSIGCVQVKTNGAPFLKYGMGNAEKEEPKWIHTNRSDA